LPSGSALGRSVGEPTDSLGGPFLSLGTMVAAEKQTNFVVYRHHRSKSRIYQPSKGASAESQGMSFFPNRSLVFVVDDDGAMLKGIARVLRQYGYDSVLFPSSKAFENHRDFEKALCIILDINLGDGSGIELRHRLKAAGNTVPVIYMTGNDTPAVRASALQSGCLAYLTKPFSAKSLIESLERASTGLT
jgi:CheY-like chemotaxis protein